MESTPVTGCSASLGDFLESVAIKYAYLHIAILRPHQRFLPFEVEDRHCQLIGFSIGPVHIPQSVYQGVGFDSGVAEDLVYPHCVVPGRPAS